MTDGYLEKGQSGEVSAILDVKAYIREDNILQIQMQESAQMAAWIFANPDDGELHHSASGKEPTRRLLVSQDNHEIYLTFAEYDAAYV